MALPQNLQKFQINNKETDNNQDTTTLLFKAVKENDLERVKILLKNGAQLNVKNTTGLSPLHKAIWKEHINLKLVQLLLNSGADVNSATKNGDTPIFEAVRVGNLQLIRILLSAEADVNVKAEEDRTPLLEAIWLRKSDEIIEILVKHGADINAQNICGITPLYALVVVNRTNMIRFFLNEGAKVNLKCVKGVTPLHRAVHNRNLEITKILLKYGADINAKTPTCLSHISLAVGGNNEVEILLNSGYVNVNVKPVEGPPFLYKVRQSNNKEIIKLLLKYDADFDVNCKEILCFLIEAIEENDAELVKVLLNKGVEFNIKIPGRYYTPLYEALKRNSIECVELLLDSFADVHETNCFDHNIFDIVFDAEIRNMIEEHLTKLMCLGLYVDEKCCKQQAACTYQFENACRKEIDILKRENITEDVTLYDILLEGVNNLLPNLIDLKLTNHKIKFPIYGGMLNRRFQTMKRKELLNYDIAFFDCFVDKLPLLPYVCRKNILSFLSIQDLRHLMKVIEGELLGEQRNAGKLK